MREISASTKIDLSTQPAMDPVARQAIARLAVMALALSSSAQSAAVGKSYSPRRYLLRGHCGSRNWHLGRFG
jgi:hypothetical protein